MRINAVKYFKLAIIANKSKLQDCNFGMLAKMKMSKRSDQPMRELTKPNAIRCLSHNEI